MTGIERLYKLIADIDVSADPGLWYILRGGTEGGWDCDERDDKPLGSTLAAIADQIEHEQGGRVSRMRVLAVVTDMERHVSGVEGMDDSPVALWARELRSALVARPLDPADDASVSAYDLLPEEERDAIAWVREHGGLSHVKDIYHDFRAVVERLGIEWSESELHGLMDTLDRRLMPEGYEWPRYEDNELVGFGDDVSRHGEDFEANVIALYRDGSFALNFWAYAKGERVRRPAVLAADGEPLEVGRTVWDVESGEELKVEELCDVGLVHLLTRDGVSRYVYPDQLTHERPDSWERVEEDIFDGFMETEETARDLREEARDIVRRCRALAERERGE